ncbi:MAG: methyltransferase [Candidatus Micrarchaeota archaeon]|nr:methyltransferase [Candidatus Micrarchaeota archaeon]
MIDKKESTRIKGLKYASLSAFRETNELSLNFPDFRRIQVSLNPKEKIPFSGLFLGENVFHECMRNKLDSALSIGTGRHAPIELYLAGLWKVKRIDSVEINPADLAIAKGVINENKLSELINLFKGSLFEPIKGKYDLIISNISHLPQPPGAKDSQHDYGGLDGWKFRDGIINKASTYLNKHGFLSLLSFDFIGVFNRYSSKSPSLVERLHSNGFKEEHIATYRRSLRTGGMTHKALDHIIRLYPEAKFYDSSGNILNNKKLPEIAEKNKIFFDVFVVTSRLI